MNGSGFHGAGIYAHGIYGPGGGDGGDVRRGRGRGRGSGGGGGKGGDDTVSVKGHEKKIKAASQRGDVAAATRLARELSHVTNGAHPGRLMGLSLQMKSLDSFQSQPPPKKS